MPLPTKDIREWWTPAALEYRRAFIIWRGSRALVQEVKDEWQANIRTFYVIDHLSREVSIYFATHGEPDAWTKANTN